MVQGCWRQTPEYVDKNVFMRRLLQLKFKMGWPGIEPGPPRWHPGDKSTEPWDLPQSFLPRDPTDVMLIPVAVCTYKHKQLLLGHSGLYKRVP